MQLKIVIRLCVLTSVLAEPRLDCTTLFSQTSFPHAAPTASLTYNIIQPQPQKHSKQQFIWPCTFKDYIPSESRCLKCFFLFVGSGSSSTGGSSSAVRGGIVYYLRLLRVTFTIEMVPFKHAQCSVLLTDSAEDSKITVGYYV